ncbi:hypothetical protein [Actinomadura madurae]|uniref:hypothetical protein n=1 Tax=Actinomadura madurae TaxID=1993 RepID=UPI0020D238DC|nr:hypothetical protein [Actinomadura madurae]MCQ0017460.1 hypothetical protein [Actinomadura madurae]
MYEAEINRATPTCMVFLLDQSASMKARIGGGSEAKQQVVADSLNHLLGELINRCVRQGDIYDFFHIGVISYGRTVGPALGGALGGGGSSPPASWPTIRCGWRTGGSAGRATGAASTSTTRRCPSGWTRRRRA